MILQPKNWLEFQHYKDRSPPWIKLHHKLLDNFDYHRLHVASRALAPCLWLLASEYDDGKITASLEEIAFRLHTNETGLIEALIPLIDGHFFIADSELLAACKQTAIPEKRREREEDIDKRRGENDHSLRSFAFSEFWQTYPNKVGKSAAQKAFARIAQAQTTTFEILMTGLRAYVAKTDDRPWCNPATWLNQGRWDDQPAEATHETGRRQQRSAITEALDRQAERYRCKDGDGDEVCENLVRLLPNR